MPYFPHLQKTSMNNILLRQMSYYQTGGTVYQLVAPSTQEELISTYREICAQKIPHFFLGAGSNSLISDEPFAGAVITLQNLQQISFASENVIRCEGGARNTDIATWLLKKGLSGGEWLYFLPGHVGATTRMNARCFGGEIGEIVTQVKALDRAAQIKIFSGSDPDVFYGYKDTVFMRNGHLIFEVSMKFSAGDPHDIKAKMLANKAQRDEKGHFSHPSCGCVFKNDYALGVPSGLLLELAGAKSLSLGKAQVNPDHANFIYNVGGASSEDILKLSFLMREKVYHMFGVWLEYEMELLGTFPAQLLKVFFKKKSPNFKTAALAEAKHQFQKK